MTLFSNRVFNGAIVSNLLSLMGFAGFVFFAAQFLQLVVGMSPPHLMRREAEHDGLHLSVRELLATLAGIEETVLL